MLGVDVEADVLSSSSPLPSAWANTGLIGFFKCHHLRKEENQFSFTRLFSSKGLLVFLTPASQR